MDPISMAYYATICGLLGVASPWLGRISVRFVLAAIVGLIAAGALPYVRGTLPGGPYGG